MNTQQRINDINAGLELLIKNNEDIEAIISFGSYGHKTIDQFSDIDLFLFTKNTKKYFDKKNNHWIASVGNVLSRYTNKNTLKNKLVMDDGLMYDITIVNINNIKIMRFYFFLRRNKLLKLLPSFIKKLIEKNITTFHKVTLRGYKINYDKHGKLPPIIKQIKDFGKATYFPNKINKKLFTFYSSFFWHCCYSAAIKLIREETYYTIIVYFDKAIKKELLRMIEWKTLMENEKTDVYYDGYKMKNWGDKIIVEKYNKTLYYNEIEGMYNSLTYSMNLYKELSHKLAKAYNYPLNYDFENFVIDFVENIAIPQNKKQLQKEAKK